MSATGMQPQGLYGGGDRGERGGDAGGGRNDQGCGGRQVRRPACARRCVASHQPRRHVHHASGYDALVQGRGGAIPLYRGAGPVTQRARSRHGNAPRGRIQPDIPLPKRRVQDRIATGPVDLSPIRHSLLDYFAFACQSPKTPPVGSWMMENEPMSGTSETSRMILASNVFAFLVAATTLSTST